MIKKDKYCGSDVAADTLGNLKIKYVFGVPGAKIDRVFDSILDLEESKRPETIVTRHEQNAMFLATGIYRLIDEPQLVLTTSGAGTANMACGMITAKQDGDAVLCMSANVSLYHRNKETHQVMENTSIFRTICKATYEPLTPETIGETIANAYRTSITGNPGPVYVSIPQDIQAVETKALPIDMKGDYRKVISHPSEIEKAIALIKQAKTPLIFLGKHASSKDNAYAIREFVKKTKIGVVGTYQSAGAMSKELDDLFFGRVSLWKTTPADAMIKASDLLIIIGHNNFEEDPILINSDKSSKIIHIGNQMAEIDNFYQPEVEVIGNIDENVKTLTSKIDNVVINDDTQKLYKSAKAKYVEMQSEQYWGISQDKNKDKVHPIELMKILREKISDDTIVSVDVGSIYLWMAKFFNSYEPRTLLFSNGMQTLGVGLPWGMASCLVHPNKIAISMSGDGGFQFSMNDFVIAVQKNMPLVHIIWNDGTYDMVKFQQILKYDRATAVDLGGIDFVKYAESCGGKGFRVNTPNEFKEALDKAIALRSPVIIDVNIDYSNNLRLSNDPTPEI